MGCVTRSTPSGCCSRRACLLELLDPKDQAMLVGRGALLVLDLGLDVVSRVGRLDLERDGLGGRRLDQDLHVDNLQRTG